MLTAQKCVVTQARRAALLERETGLQRWAIKLELESSRQAAAAKTLQQQLQKVLHVQLYAVSLTRVYAVPCVCASACVRVCMCEMVLQRNNGFYLLVMPSETSKHNMLHGGH